MSVSRYSYNASKPFRNALKRDDKTLRAQRLPTNICENYLQNVLELSESCCLRPNYRVRSGHFSSAVVLNLILLYFKRIYLCWRRTVYRINFVFSCSIVLYLKCSSYTFNLIYDLVNRVVFTISHFKVSSENV